MPYLFYDLRLLSLFSGIGAFEKALNHIYGDKKINKKNENVIKYVCLKYQRTEYAKKIRKDYESGKIRERRCNLREYTIRQDGCCNTISTVTKDNYILEINKTF